MHDGAFTSPTPAIRHHLNAEASLLAYDPATHDLPSDLAGPIGPTAPLLAALDPRLTRPIRLTPAEFDNLMVGQWPRPGRTGGVRTGAHRPSQGEAPRVVA
jgi:hypothetical protein